MEFRLTNETDIIELQTWFTSLEEVKNWGGPRVSFPFILEQFKKDIGWNIITSYSMVFDDELVGFVQVFDKYGYIHIGRVVINPIERGNTFGIKLMEALFQKYKDSNQGYSLFVYKDNVIAKKLYEKVGFEISSSSTDYEKINNCLFMKKV